MPTSLTAGINQLDDLQLKSYYATITRDGISTSLGFVDEGSLSVTITPKIISKGVDQLAADVAKAWLVGYNASVSFTLSGTDAQFVAETLLGSALGVRGDNTTANGPGYGIGNIGEDASSRMAGELVLVPVDNDAGDMSNSFVFWKAIIPDGQGLTWSGNKGAFQNLPVTMVALPDLSQDKEFYLGMFGNIAANDGAPDNVWISTSSAVAPYKHLTAATLSVGNKQDFQAWGVWATDGAVTAALNDGTDINTTDTTITYDTLAGGAFAVGDIIKMGTELMYVSADSGTALTVVRSVMGSTAAAHLDNAVITVQDIVRTRITEQATWASSDATKAAVGNTAGETDDDKKGRVRNVATGSANVTATLTAIASPSLAITAS